VKQHAQAVAALQAVLQPGAEYSDSVRTASTTYWLSRTPLRGMMMTTQSGQKAANRANKVLGTAVKDKAGHKIGEIGELIRDKQSNDIMFAVVSFGGVLGFAEKDHPLPWSTLSYDEGESSYVVDATREQLASVLADSLDELTDDDDLASQDAAQDRSSVYYRAPRYW
jgi:hypothetical protein